MFVTISIIATEKKSLIQDLFIHFQLKKLIHIFFIHISQLCWQQEWQPAVQIHIWAEGGGGGGTRSARQSLHHKTSSRASHRRAQAGQPGRGVDNNDQSVHRLVQRDAISGTGGGSCFSRTHRRTDWRAERTSVLQKGWLLAWCRSSMDLLQDLALSKKPSSPLSSPSKSNLGPPAHTNGQADTEEAREGSRWAGVVGRGG